MPTPRSWCTVPIAHGLAAAQKNWAEWDGTAVGFDFAIAEQCAQYHECGSYVAHYGRHVLAVEYGDAAFAPGLPYLRRHDRRRAARRRPDHRRRTPLVRPLNLTGSSFVVADEGHPVLVPIHSRGRLR